MDGTPSYENMSLEEFINQPYIVPLYSKDGPAFESRIKDIPFIKIGKIVRGDYAVIYVDSRRFYDLFEVLGSEFVEILPQALTLLGRASLEASTIMQVQQQPFLSLKGRGTLIGIIDTGIDYTKEAFKYEDGTSKIRYIWDQTIEGKPPGDFLYGSEYTNEEINHALQTDTPYNYVPSTDTVGHGTFLASVAASRQNSEYIGAAPDAELLIVKLRRMHEFLYDYYHIPESYENAFSGVDVMLAIEYMVDKAKELGMPLTICIGLGSSLTAHDGFENLDKYIAGISLLSGICICTAAGNESNAGHHTSGVLLETGSSYGIQIRVPQNANGFVLIIIVNPSDRMSVSLKSPLGEIVPRSVAISGERTVSRLILEKSRITVETYFPVSGSGVQIIIVKFYNPTPGVWNITLYGDIILNGGFNAWLPITGLVTPGVAFLTPDPFTTVVAPGVSSGSITCGAYDDRTDSLYINSSWGFTRISNVKPDLVAPGVDVTGIYPIGSGTMTGTSVAAAITAGACALMLQWGIVERNDVSLNTIRIRALLIRGCSRAPDMIYPSKQWGYGKLDLFNTFRLLRGVVHNNY